MRVGIVGGGQLGRMLGLAGLPLGCSFTFLDPSSAAGAGAVGRLLVAGYDDEAGLAELASTCDVVTYEFENVPADAARRVERSVPVYPPPRALELIQDRLTEKELFDSCGLAVAPYRAATGHEELAAAFDVVGAPAIVKTRREGYDGKGQLVVRTHSDLEDIDEAMRAKDLLVERMVDLRRELSIIAVRGKDGEVTTYPLVENLHHEGILRVSRAPAPGTDDVGDLAEKAIRSVMDELDYVGVLTMELFETQAGELLGNEMAPRVHNSGHWTIEGAETSQFENHIRAVTGRPLGSTAARGHSAMVNLIGQVPDPMGVLGVPGAHLHLYDKEPRAGRKLGHITVRSDSAAEVEEGLEALRGLPGVYLGEPGRTLL
jgi:5-(carboxyamino)imidazole ribonucleotide synthase